MFTWVRRNEHGRSHAEQWRFHVMHMYADLVGAWRLWVRKTECIQTIGRRSNNYEFMITTSTTTKQCRRNFTSPIQGLKTYVGNLRCKAGTRCVTNVCMLEMKPWFANKVRDPMYHVFNRRMIRNALCIEISPQCWNQTYIINTVSVRLSEGTTESRLKVSDFQYSGLLFAEHVWANFGTAMASRSDPKR